MTAGVAPHHHLLVGIETTQRRAPADPDGQGAWALVLNGTYQPLTVVPARRAAVLVLEGTAECVETGSGRLRSNHRSVEIPSVIRLHRVVRVRWRTTAPLTRRTVLARDERRCGYCGGSAETVDHVVPRSRGGRNCWTNVVAACHDCNNAKAARTPTEAGMRLLVEPHEPVGAAALAMILPRLEPHWRRWFGLRQAA